MTVIQQNPYLQKQRNFPKDELDDLAAQVDLAYIDIATKVNDRTIGQFAANIVVVTGERWFLQGEPKPQHTLRKLFVLTGNSPITHGINVAQIEGFTKIYGTFTDGTNWYPLPYVSTTITDQIQIVVTPTQIQITSGGTAPTIISGFIILEYLAVF